MSSQLLDKLMREEYERSIRLEDDESPRYNCFKEEEEDDFYINPEDDRIHLSELISRDDEIINKIQEDTHHSIVQNTQYKDELDINYDDKSTILMNIKEENDLCTNFTDSSFHLMNIKEENEFDYDVYNESTLNENEFCIDSQNFKQSLLELIKEEDDEDDDMYESFTDITSYEDILNIPLEDDKSHISELIENRVELNSEKHYQFTESFIACSTTEDYKLPFFDEDFATSFLIQKNLLANNKNYKCHKCGSSVKYYIRLDRGKRRKVLRCKKKGCQTTQSLRKNNSFWACIDKNGRSISKLSISAQLELVYYWCQNFSAYAIISITGKSNHTVYNWMSLCQEVPLRMFKKRTQFGGPGIIIHVNYRSLTQLKIRKSEHLNNPSKSLLAVFVIYSDDEERYFLLEKHDTTALHKIIKQEVAVDSVIHSYRWMECNELLKFGYNHHIVNLDEDFNNSFGNSHIQRIESLWKPLVLFYKCRRGITPALFSSFLIETWWRGLNKSDPFNAFLRDMAEVF